MINLFLWTCGCAYLGQVWNRLCCWSSSVSPSLRRLRGRSLTYFYESESSPLPVVVVVLLLPTLKYERTNERTNDVMGYYFICKLLEGVLKNSLLQLTGWEDWRASFSISKRVIHSLIQSWMESFRERFESALITIYYSFTKLNKFSRQKSKEIFFSNNDDEDAKLERAWSGLWLMSEWDETWRER